MFVKLQSKHYRKWAIKNLISKTRRFNFVIFLSICLAMQVNIHKITLVYANEKEMDYFELCEENLGDIGNSDLSRYAENPHIKGRSIENLPTSYGGVSKGVYDQEDSPTCWAFASTSAFEYAVDKQNSTNKTSFSVEHMVEKLSIVGNCGFLATEKAGFTTADTASYFVSGYGPVNSEDYPWIDNHNLVENYDFGLAEYRATDVKYIADDRKENGTLEDNVQNIIKQSVYDSGSVVCRIGAYNECYNKACSAYYTPSVLSKNHAVLIVGWNDNFSKTNFNTEPESDGAWLVRNSWGSDWGINGYYWVSYEDHTITPLYTITAYEEMEENETVYNLDESGAGTVIGSSANKNGFLNVFDIGYKEELDAVTIYETSTTALCRIYYVPVGEDGIPNPAEKVAISDEVSIEYSGYHTIDVEDVADRLDGEKFGILVYIEDENGVNIGIESSSSGVRKATIEEGESYFYHVSTEELTDAYSYDNNSGNFSIKLVTRHLGTSMNKCDIEEIDHVTYSTYEITPGIVASYNGTMLKEGEDYLLYYSDNIDAGTATITVEGRGDFYGTRKVTFEIKQADISDCEVSQIGIQGYTGDVLTPKFEVTYNGVLLSETSDYHIAHALCTDVGEGLLYLIGANNFTNRKAVYFTITNDLSYAVIEGLKDYEYTGELVTKDVTVTLGEVILVQNVDYVVSVVPHYTPWEVGTYNYYVIGMGKYTGQTVLAFEITPADISKAEISSIPTQTYTGREITPNPEITFNGEKLEEGIDYTLSYRDNVEKGDATLIVNGIGNFKGSKEAIFVIK